PNGIDSLKELITNQGALPNTVQALTGSGGYHFLFKHKEGIKNKTNIKPGLDIRGDGGYIVASPSLHRVGKRYEWKPSNNPIDKEIAEAPSWLIDMVKDQSYGGRPQVKTSSYWKDIMQGLIEGEGRNSASASLVGYLLRRHVD